MNSQLMVVKNRSVKAVFNRAVSHLPFWFGAGIVAYLARYSGVPVLLALIAVPVPVLSLYLFIEYLVLGNGKTSFNFKDKTIVLFQNGIYRTVPFAHVESVTLYNASGERGVAAGGWRWLLVNDYFFYEIRLQGGRSFYVTSFSALERLDIVSFNDTFRTTSRRLVVPSLLYHKWTRPR